ncbi:ABC transporter permease [Chloroflexota bacterium]
MDVTPGETPQEVAAEKKRPPMLIDVFKRLIKEKPLGVVGGIIVLILLFAGSFADVLAPYGFNELDMAARLDGPSPDHILGCDNLGRDLLSRVIFGARISMFVGFGVTIFSTIGGVLIGIVSGYVGGKFDLIMQRFVDAWMALPGLFILLSMIAVLGPGLVQVIIVLGVRQSISESRIIRGAVIGIKENVYVEAARAIGVPTISILWRHLLPNIFAAILILFTGHISSAIMMESTMSFLGFGIPPPMPSWGGMLSGAGRRYMILAPWLAFWPGLALAAVVYGANMFGDALRDLLDPRLRGGIGRYGGVTQEKLLKMVEDRKAKLKAA